MRVSYIRVSSADQNETRQVEGLAEYTIEKSFTEKVSAKSMDRPKLQEVLEFVRSGDTLYVLSFDRLARSTSDLLKITELLEKKGVHLVSKKENIDTSTPMGKFFLTVIAAIAELERATILERQREGIAIAKAKGLYKGRHAVEIPNFPECYDRYMKREVSKVQLSKELKISRNTLDKLIKEYTEKTA